MEDELRWLLPKPVGPTTLLDVIIKTTQAHFLSLSDSEGLSVPLNVGLRNKLFHTAFLTL